MPDFRKMKVRRLRDLASEVLGPSGARLKRKAELVAALERAEGKPKARPSQAAARAARTTEKAAQAAAKAVRKVKAAGAKPAKQARSGKAARATVAGAVKGRARAVRAQVRRAAEEAGAGDPEGYFVARVRGEEAIREAPHPMTEPPPRGAAELRALERRPGGRAAPAEDLGELPWSYGDDAFVALPRDPRSLFLYWDWSQPAVATALSDLDHPRVQLWIFARAGGGWERVRAIEFALESRGYYVHDLEPGRTYRAEIRAVDGAGNDRLLGRGSNEVALPHVGPSPIVDDRFLRLSWEVPLGQLLGPGHAGALFSDEARDLLARMSDWERFTGRVWGGSAGGMGGRPSSPTGGPSSPSSPFGPLGGGEG